MPAPQVPEGQDPEFDTFRRWWREMGNPASWPQVACPWNFRRGFVRWDGFGWVQLDGETVSLRCPLELDVEAVLDGYRAALRGSGPEYPPGSFHPRRSYGPLTPRPRSGWDLRQMGSLADEWARVFREPSGLGARFEVENERYLDELPVDDLVRLACRADNDTPAARALARWLIVPNRCVEDLERLAGAQGWQRQRSSRGPVLVSRESFWWSRDWVRAAARVLRAGRQDLVPRLARSAGVCWSMGAMDRAGNGPVRVQVRSGRRVYGSRPRGAPGPRWLICASERGLTLLIPRPPLRVAQAAKVSGRSGADRRQTSRVPPRAAVPGAVQLQLIS